MNYYVYMLKAISSKKKKTYVGYTGDLNKRLTQHNTNKGAKFTKGNTWKIIFKKKFILKSDAMTYEYELKHDKNKRLNIYNNSK
jgi:putative endonuclease